MIEPEVAADDKIKTGGRPVFEVTEQPSKGLARQSPTVLCEDHEAPPRVKRLLQHPRFLAENPPGITAATARYRFQDPIFGRPTLLNPLAIGLDLLVERAHAMTAEPEKAGFHFSAGADGSSIPRAASSSRGASPQRLSRP